MTNFKIKKYFKIPDKTFSFSVKYFFSIIFKFYIKRKIPYVHLRYFFEGGRPSQTNK